MPVQRLKKFLDENDVRYVTISHSPSYTSLEVAASAHVKGQQLAKTVMVKLDGKMAMAVLPASYAVDLDLLQVETGASSSALATEAEFATLFPGCELGAMPPFGNLYGMKVYAEQSLEANADIAFNAGTHRELVKLAWKDFLRLVQPVVIKFA
ncbi:MAG TPA: YbaK/EbsC family protein [Vicinamibacterales bacterium]|nr:YbaK/EbsC family protein [Vicinamibacterales bacterium]